LLPAGRRQLLTFLQWRNGSRVLLPAPRRSKLCITCSDFFQKSERTHSAAPPFQPRPACAGLASDDENGSNQNCLTAPKKFEPGSLPALHSRLLVYDFCRILRILFSDRWYLRLSAVTPSPDA